MGLISVINSKETSHESFAPICPHLAIVSKLAALSSLNEHMYSIVRVVYQSKFAKVKLCLTIQTKVASYIDDISLDNSHIDIILHMYHINLTK